MGKRRSGILAAQRPHSRARESGQAMIEGVVAVLVMITLAMGAADIGGYVLAWASCDQAATEACRTLMADPSSITTSETDATAKVVDAALAASPNLSADSTKISYKSVRSAQTTYTHHFADATDEDDGVVEREGSVADLHDGELTLTSKFEAITPFGSMFGNGDGTYTIKIARPFEYDTTAAPAEKGGGNW